MSRNLPSMRFRLFMITAALACLWTCSGIPPSERRPAPIHVTVLFFNDLHGHLAPFEISCETGMDEVGGIARIATLVRRIREENREKNVRTLVLVAGDLLLGTPMATVFKGEPDILCLNAMGVDAMTVGNHEFDFGLDHLLKLKEQADFPFLSANIVLKESGDLLFQPAMDIHLEDRVALTIIGVTTQALLTTTLAENVAPVDVLDPVAAVIRARDGAHNPGPILLLSHSRQATDRAMARVLPDLAAIIGGHDQSLLSPPGMEGRVPLFQAFEKGRYLGRLDLNIDPVSLHAEWVDARYIQVTADIDPDPEIAGIVNDYTARLGREFKQVIGHCGTFLDGEREHIRNQETNLGNFITDVMRSHTGARIALINAGALRESIRQGPVTVEDIFKAMPYDNELICVDLTGAEIQQALLHSVRGSQRGQDGGFLQVSGLSFDVRGGSAEHIRVGKEGQPLDPAVVYSVVMNDFLASGGDGYAVFKAKPQVRTGSPLRELIIDTVRRRKVISAKTEGRIRCLE